MKVSTINRNLACLVSLALLASCASNKADARQQLPEAQRGVNSDAAQQGEVVRIVQDGQPRIYGQGTRYITTLGLPAEVRVTPPDWIVNPAIDGVLGAIGVASKNDLGTRQQLGEARLDGRLELAHMLETRIQGVGRGDVEQYLQVIRSGGATGDENSSKKSNLGVDRNITDLVLSGSRQRALWFDPSSGDCYVWVVMDGGIPALADHTVENGVSVYVANRPMNSEYRPDWPSEPEPEPQPVLQQQAPAPPTTQKTPTEVLEEALKPIETIPVGGADAAPKGGSN